MPFSWLTAVPSAEKSNRPCERRDRLPTDRFNPIFALTVTSAGVSCAARCRRSFGCAHAFTVGWNLYPLGAPATLTARLMPLVPGTVVGDELVGSRRR